MGKPTDEQLRPYGFTPGRFRKWCAACGNEQGGLGTAAFKCRRCAEFQFKEVERLCRSAGYGDDR